MGSSHGISVRYLPDRVVELEFDTPTTLLNFISPTGLRLAGKNLFRGQADSSWSLVPSAFRLENLLRKKGPNWTCRDQAVAEIEAVMLFVRLCDEQGLPIPEGFEAVMKGLEYQKDQQGTGWPRPPLLPAVALAQHHRIPTRLLDWTTNPYSALYFAASEAIMLNGSQKLAVWMISMSDKCDHDSPSSPSDLECIRPTYNGNENLRAQAGYFLVSRTHRDPDWEFEYKPLEAIASSSLCKNGEPRYQVFVKLTLDSGYAEQILVDLDTIGINASSLYPGFSGASKTVLLRLSAEKLRRPPNLEMGRPIRHSNCWMSVMEKIESYSYSDERRA